MHFPKKNRSFTVKKELKTKYSIILIKKIPIILFLFK